MAVPGHHVGDPITEASLEECQNVCLNDALCHLIDYQTTTEACYFNDVSRLEAGEDWDPWPDYTVYDYFLSPTGKTI